MYLNNNVNLVFIAEMVPKSVLTVNLLLEIHAWLALIRIPAYSATATAT